MTYVGDSNLSTNHRSWVVQMFVEGSGWTNYEDTESYVEAKTLVTNLNRANPYVEFRVYESLKEKNIG